MSFIINPFLNDRNTIVSVENPVALSVSNGTVAGSLVFQPTIKAKLAGGFYRNIDVSYDTTGYNGAVNGSYILTGTLAPDLPVTNPFNLTVSIVVWVIPVGYLWIDCIDKNQIVGAIDNFTRITTQVTPKTLSGLIQKTALLLNRPSWNGEGEYFNTQASMLQAGTTSVYTRFSNGGQFTMFLVWKQLTLATDKVGVLFDAINQSSLNTGIGLYVDNRSSLTRSYALNFVIAKSVGGQAPINAVCANDLIVVNAWNRVKITYNGTNVVITINGSVASTTAPAFSFSASNPGNLLTYGNMFTTGTSTGNKMYLKHVYMEDSFLSGADLTSLETWATAMCQENLEVTDANIYMQVGQSNCAGRGLNSEIAPELADRVGAVIMWPQPTPATSTPGSGTIHSDSYFQELQLGVSQTFESIATQHGMEMRFGYEMHQFNENCWIVKYGVGGTPIFEQGTYNNWNITTPTLYTQAHGLMTTAFDEATHIFRRNPIWRGLSIMQGETDALASMAGAGAVYKVNWQDVINGWIDVMVAAGYTIDKLRIYFWQISDAGGFAYDPTEFAAVKAAQAAFPTTYFADYPARAANVRGIETRTTDDIDFEDTQHYSAAGQDARGVIEFDYYKIWAAE